MDRTQRAIERPQNGKIPASYRPGLRECSMQGNKRELERKKTFKFAFKTTDILKGDMSCIPCLSQ